MSGIVEMVMVVVGVAATKAVISLNLCLTKPHLSVDDVPLVVGGCVCSFCTDRQGYCCLDLILGN